MGVTEVVRVIVTLLSSTSLFTRRVGLSSHSTVMPDAGEISKRNHDLDLVF